MNIPEKIKKDIVSKVGEKCGVAGFYLNTAIQSRIALGYKITSITLDQDFKDVDLNIYSIIHE